MAIWIGSRVCVHGRGPLCVRLCGAQGFRVGSAFPRWRDGRRKWAGTPPLLVEGRENSNLVTAVATSRSLPAQGRGRDGVRTP
eukprot:173903-Alexandrium_andersonii.AAC.1